MDDSTPYAVDDGIGSWGMDTPVASRRQAFNLSLLDDDDDDDEDGGGGGLLVMTPLMGSPLASGRSDFDDVSPSPGVVPRLDAKISPRHLRGGVVQLL